MTLGPGVGRDEGFKGVGVQVAMVFLAMTSVIWGFRAWGLGRGVGGLRFRMFSVS